MVSCIRLLSELWGILSIGATSGLTMPHRCDNHPLSTWPSCRLSKNNTALFTGDVRLSALSEWLWEMNIFISFVTNFCIIKNIFLGKDSWSCNSYVFPRLYTMFNLLIDNWKIDIAIKREKIQLSLISYFVLDLVHHIEVPKYMKKFSIRINCFSFSYNWTETNNLLAKLM